MTKTKDKILNASKELFNLYGVANVKLRTIAAHLEISQGNLNYHFKKRDDILESLYFDMVSVFDQRLIETRHKEITLDLIYVESKKSMQRMFEYRFVWRDLYQLLRSNEKIKNHFIKAQKGRIAGTSFVFNSLVNDGLMSKESFNEEYKTLAMRLINYSDFWICSASMYEEDITDELIFDSHKSYMSIFYPYLTSKGKKALNNIFKSNEV